MNPGRKPTVIMSLKKPMSISVSMYEIYIRTSLSCTHTIKKCVCKAFPAEYRQEHTQHDQNDTDHGKLRLYALEIFICLLHVHDICCVIVSILLIDSRRCMYSS